MGRKVKKAKVANSDAENKNASKKLNQQTLDEFIENWSDEDDDYIKDNFGSDESESESKAPKNKKKAASSNGEKKYLVGLQRKDPEFYKFLKENDEELLDFDVDDEADGDFSADSSEEDDDSDDSDSDAAEEGEEDGSEEEDSSPEDESDGEPEEDDDDEESSQEVADETTNGTGEKPNSAPVKKWQDRLEAGKVDVTLLSGITSAFGEAVAHGYNEGKKSKSTKDAKSIMGLCLNHMAKAFKTVLGVKDKNSSVDGATMAKTMQKSKNWEPLQATLGAYASNLAKVLGAVKDSTELCAWLQHVHAMLPCFVAGRCPRLLEELAVLCSSTDDAAVSSFAFQAVLSLTKRNLATNFKVVFERMHTEYVEAAKRNAATPTRAVALPRESLSKITALDAKAACKLAVEAVRGLEADLKTEKESVVCDWRFVLSLQRWTNVLCDLRDENLRQQVMSPLVNILVGALKMFKTSQYYPLRFRICDMLTEISFRTGKFVPVLPHYLDVLRNYDFSKKEVKKTSTDEKSQPILLRSVLKVPKLASSDNSLTDFVADGVYRGVLKYLGLHSNSIAFPELVVPALAELKAFEAAKCSVAGYSKRIKQLAEKIEENSRHISTQRRNATFGVKSSENILRWEEAVRDKGTPMSRFYTAWTATTGGITSSKKKKNKNKAKKRKLKRDLPKEANEVVPAKKIKKVAKVNGSS